MYEIMYDVDDDTRNVTETFEGSYDEMRQYLRDLRADGCYNITASWIGGEDAEY